MHYIASTVTSPLRFVKYSECDPRQVPTELRAVIIRGGANLPDKTLYTPRGVLTKVSDEDLAFLLSDPKFIEMANAGYLTVLRDSRDLDNAVADMTPKDKCAPKVEADFARVKNNTDGEGITVGRSAEAIAAR